MELNVENDELLDFDQPLAGQSALVRKAFIKLGYDSDFEVNTGKYFYERLSEAQGYDEVASKALSANGIKGIRYFDQDSRHNEWTVWGNKGKFHAENYHQGKSHEFSTRAAAQKFVDQRNAARTHNYVIFDEKDITITHENGVPVAQAGPLFAAAPERRPSAEVGERWLDVARNPDSRRFGDLIDHEIFDTETGEVEVGKAKDIRTILQEIDAEVADETSIRRETIEEDIDNPDENGKPGTTEVISFYDKDIRDSATANKAFMDSLTPAQRRKYEQDKEQRREVWGRFREMLNSVR
ncbi:MAG: hypothetical protein LBK76_09020 [Verrucomicrobiales bacterium]|nr:hypothetical protein [Verrucomicrobiales bacterium]